MARVEGQGGHLSLMHTAAWQTIGRASHPLLTPLGPAHLQPPDPGPALLCCPLEVQRTLSRGLQQVRGRDSSLALMTPRARSPTMPRGEGEPVCTTLRHQHGMSAWPLEVTDPCCCSTTDPDMAPGGSIGQGPTMVPGGITPFCHQTVALFFVFTSFCFSFSFIPPPLTCSS